MDIVELRKLRGEALAEYARSIGDDERELCAAIAALIASGEQSDFETIAALLSYITVGVGDPNDYYARSQSLDKRYLDIFIAYAERAGVPEREYISVMIASRNADRDGALYKWRDVADEYLKRRAERDYEFVADCVDLYDPKFGAYDVLFEVDHDRTARRLLHKLLYVKHTDKSAIREFFMDKPAVVDGLVELYGKSNAHERVKIVRLLGVLKNYARVSEFLSTVAAKDRSKSVRTVVSRLDMRSAKRSGGSAVEFFEHAMISGDGIPIDEFEGLMCDEEYAAVADRIFFCTGCAPTLAPEVINASDDDFSATPPADTRLTVLMYDRGDFIGLDDKRVELDENAVVRVIHPVEMPTEANFVFTLSIDQPFEQVWRAVYRPSRGEISYSDRLNGTIIDRATFDANFKRGGFVFCADSDGDTATATLAVRGFAVAVACDISHRTSVACRRITFYRASSIVKNRKLYIPANSEVAVCDVDGVAFSELMLAVHRLFGVE